jgi:uncharacterized protein (TIGR03437 family)
MQLRHIKFLFPLTAFLVLGLSVAPGQASGQTQDSSQNGLLKGSYRFRDVAVQNVDEFFNPSEVTATYGTITFDGAGNYTIAGTQVDNVATNGLPVALNVTGTYAIGSNGLGYLTNLNFPTDPAANIYGAVSQGVYAGSATEVGQDGNFYNDIFIAIPAASSAPSNASFTASYQAGLLDFTSGGSTAIKNALFELSPNGKGGFGTISLNGQAANQSASTLTQTVTGATYNFNSDSSASLTMPLPAGVNSTNALFTGGKTMFESADGNFILGWTATGYDIFFGVKALAASASNGTGAGLYFTSALEDAPSGDGTDSYYGSTNNSGNGNGDGIVHYRLNLPGELAFDYGTDDQIELNADGTVFSASGSTDLNGYSYNFGDGGLAFVAIGTNGNFSLLVGLHAAAFSGSGVFLNPIGVNNAASGQPVTASIAPGELLVLYGSGLASSTVVTQGGQTFPTQLGGVTVSIDGLACPIYYVTAGQLAVTVPFGVASNQTGLANIQVNNNGVLSNVVQVYLTDALPGSFSQTASGIGYAAATHAATGQLITAANPAEPGEYISLYLTGLGTVTPAVQDGAVGPSSPLSWSDLYQAGNLTVNFNDYFNGTAGNAGTIAFAGLAPTLAGLYQINVQVPTSGLVSGDNVYVELITDAADENQIQIPYGLGAPTPQSRSGPKAKAAVIAAARARGKKQASRARGPGSGS